VTPRVSIVLVNWNGLHHLEKCLPALGAQTFPDFEIFLVDNGSTDGSTEWVRGHYPQVRLICNDHNTGFAVANNQAMRQSQAEFIVTLNNDTQVEPTWLAALVAVAETDPSVGMVASKMLFTQQPEVINSTGIALDPVGIAWDRQGGTLDDPNEEQPIEVFGPCAGAALYRRAMLDQIGLFDEAFFAYAEDVDLAWRARWAGWRCLYVPAARVHHDHSATGGEGSPFKSRLLGRNKVWLIAKNYGPLGRLLLYLPLIVVYDLAAVVYALVVRRDVYTLVGRLEGLAGLPQMWRKRAAIVGTAESSPWYHHLEPLVSPWQVARRYRHLRSLVPKQGHGS